MNQHVTALRFEGNEQIVIQFPAAKRSLKRADRSLTNVHYGSSSERLGGIYRQRLSPEDTGLRGTE
jgi:hypothetical protein